MRNYRRLTPTERDRLAVWVAQGVSLRTCAKRLRRNVSSLSREVERNSFKGYYVSIHDQSQADQREKIKAHLKQPLKNPKVYSYVTKKLRDGWSPDEISGRLKKEHLNDSSWWICHETIYRWIYQPEQMRRDDPYYEYLRRKQKKRKKNKGRKVFRSVIPDRISISQRKEKVNQRKEFGHWEGDTVESKGHRDGVHTEIERMSRKIMAAKVRSITSEETVAAQESLFKPLPKDARKSTTLDNGRENHLHYQLKDNLKMQTFFAHPYSSFERGSNEHGNWLLRYYFPKGTDFKRVEEEELQDVVNELNNRPRKILGYQTANEKFEELLKKGAGVALES